MIRNIEVVECDKCHIRQPYEDHFFEIYEWRQLKYDTDSIYNNNAHLCPKCSIKLDILTWFLGKKKGVKS